MKLWAVLSLLLYPAFVVLLTPVIRRHALRVMMVHKPGPRSSHVGAPPRGGGLALVVGFLAIVLTALIAGDMPSGVGMALLGGGALVALVGWLDDRAHLGSYLRLGLYGLASAWAVFWLQGLPSLDCGVGVLRLGGVGYPLGWCAIMLLTNVFNFMDGIDGIAATEATVVGGAAGVLLLLHADPSLAVLALALGIGSGAFLTWNWHPARIFMGDVGSNFLGFTIAVLAIASEGRHSLPALVWVLLLGVFVVDGVSTFVRRLLRRKPPHEAHRTHAYQGAVQRGYSHSTVTLAVLLINAALSVLAWAAWRTPMLLLPLIGGAFILLFALHWCYSPLRHRESG